MRSGDYCVRRILQLEYDEVLRELRNFSDTIGGKYKMFPADKTYQRKLLEYLSSGDGLLLGCFRHGELAGIIGGHWNNHLLNPEIRILNEVFFWVVPSYRGSRTGYLLFERFIQIGKDRGANWIMMGNYKGSSMNPRSLEKRGFEEKESVYILEL